MIRVEEGVPAREQEACDVGSRFPPDLANDYRSTPANKIGCAEEDLSFRALDIDFNHRWRGIPLRKRV
jgi:hypothetical protein